MSRWQGRWLVWMWLLLPGTVCGQTPLLVPRASGASDIANVDEPLKLARPANTGAKRANGASDSSRSKPTSWTTTTASLIFVLSLIAGGAYLFGRQGRRFAGLLPDEVVQVLGRRFLDQRTSLQLVRCGSKILILSNSSQHGLRPLSEITDPHEVELITGQCLPAASGTARSILEKVKTDSPRQFANLAPHRGTSGPANSGGPHA